MVSQKVFPQSEIQSREFQNTRTHAHPHTPVEADNPLQRIRAGNQGVCLCNSKMGHFSCKCQRKLPVKCSGLPGWKSVETSNTIVQSSFKVGQYQTGWAKQSWCWFSTSGWSRFPAPQGWCPLPLGLDSGIGHSTEEKATAPSPTVLPSQDTEAASPVQHSLHRRGRPA